MGKAAAILGGRSRRWTSGTNCSPKPALLDGTTAEREELFDASGPHRGRAGPHPQRCRMVFIIDELALMMTNKSRDPIVRLARRRGGGPDPSRRAPQANVVTASSSNMPGGGAPGRPRDGLSPSCSTRRRQLLGRATCCLSPRTPHMRAPGHPGGRQQAQGRQVREDRRRPLVRMPTVRSARRRSRERRDNAEKGPAFDKAVEIIPRDKRQRVPSSAASPSATPASRLVDLMGMVSIIGDKGSVARGSSSHARNGSDEPSSGRRRRHALGRQRHLAHR